MKKWILKSGILTSILGAIGVAVCCIPFVAGFFAAVGISVLFLHKVSVYFVILGIILIPRLYSANKKNFWLRFLRWIFILFMLPFSFAMSWIIFNEMPG